MPACCFATSQQPPVYAPDVGVPRSCGVPREIVVRAVDAGLRIPGRTGIKCLHMDSSAMGASVCLPGPCSGGIFKLLQPFCVSEPVFLLPMGLRAFAGWTG